VMKEGRKEGRKANRIGYMLCRNGLLKHYIEEKVEGRIEVARRRGRRSKRPLDGLREKAWQEIERGSTRSPSVENWLWKRLWTCRKADYSMSE